MIVWGIVTWWYGEGLRQCARRVNDRLEAYLDYFSLDFLLKTLFSPFRQISAGSVNGSLETQMRAFMDRLISRGIGAVVRLLTICVGSIFIAGNLVYGLIVIVFWVVLPVLPIVGLSLSLMGWLPWSN